MPPASPHPELLPATGAPTVTTAGSPPAPSSTPEPAACASCANSERKLGAPSPTYVYAFGTIRPVFASTALEKEYLQVRSQAPSTDKTEHQVLYDVLSSPDNRYLARKLCWLLAIEGVDTYFLQLADPTDLPRLIEAVRPLPNPRDIDLVIGMLGPITPSWVCAGVSLPVVVIDQVYSFDTSGLLASLPVPKGMTKQQFAPIASEMFERIMQMADNVGATDEHRALNYLAVRSRELYVIAASQYARDFALAEVLVRPSRLAGPRKLLNVVFTFANRQTSATEKYRVRVDVTEEFPFMQAPMEPFVDRD